MCQIHADITKKDCICLTDPQSNSDHIHLILFPFDKIPRNFTFSGKAFTTQAGLIVNDKQATIYDGWHPPYQRFEESGWTVIDAKVKNFEMFYSEKNLRQNAPRHNTFHKFVSYYELSNQG